jgi:hypothetical protein
MGLVSEGDTSHTGCSAFFLQFLGHVESRIGTAVALQGCAFEFLCYEI